MKKAMLTQRFNLRGGSIIELDSDAMSHISVVYGKDRLVGYSNSSFEGASELILSDHDLGFSRRATISHDGQVRFEDSVGSENKVPVGERLVRNFQTLYEISAYTDSRFDGKVKMHFAGNSESVDAVVSELNDRNGPIGKGLGGKIFSDLDLKITDTFGNRTPGQTDHVALIFAIFNPDYVCETAGVR